MLLQAMYGAADLLIVGQFGAAADVSRRLHRQPDHADHHLGHHGLSMGTTILLGQKIGQKKPEEAGNVIGAGVCIFAVLALFLTAAMTLFAGPFCAAMQAPAEAFDKTVDYVRICSAGAVFIVAYNVLGSIFRGWGFQNAPACGIYRLYLQYSGRSAVRRRISYGRSRGRPGHGTGAGPQRGPVCPGGPKKRASLSLFPKNLRFSPAGDLQNTEAGFPYRPAGRPGEHLFPGHHRHRQLTGRHPLRRGGRSGKSSACSSCWCPPRSCSPFPLSWPKTSVRTATTEPCAPWSAACSPPCSSALQWLSSPFSTETFSPACLPEILR